MDHRSAMVFPQLFMNGGDGQNDGSTSQHDTNTGKYSGATVATVATVVPSYPCVCHALICIDLAFHLFVDCRSIDAAKLW
jgi:hypothetical protein